MALLCGALGAAVALLATRQRWAEGSATVAGGAFPLTAKGSDVTGRARGPRHSGASPRWSPSSPSAGPAGSSSPGCSRCPAPGSSPRPWPAPSDGSALDEQAAQASGDTSATVDALTHTGWPYVAAAGGLLILLAGVLALRYGAAGGPRCPGATNAAPPARGARPLRPTPSAPRRSGRPWTGGEDPTGA